jgi:hypothetical protein
MLFKVNETYYLHITDPIRIVEYTTYIRLHQNLGLYLQLALGFIKLKQNGLTNSGACPPYQVH